MAHQPRLGVALSSAAVLEITGCGGGKVGEGPLSLSDAGSRVVERRLGDEVLKRCGMAPRPAVHVGSTGAKRSREQERVGGLVELPPGPVGVAVHPLVLRPVAVRLLGCHEVRERPTGSRDRAERDERAGRFDEVA